MTGRDRHAVALGLGVILLAWVSLRAGPRVVQHTVQLRSTTQQRVDLLARAQARIAGLTDLADSITVLEGAAAELAGVLLVGEDPGTASIDLMRRVRTELRGRPMDLLGFGSVSTSGEGAEFVLVRLPVEVETDLQGLFEILQALERSRTIGLEAVDVMAPDPHADDGGPQKLNATLVLSGWYLAAADAEPAGTLEPGFVR